MTNLLLEQVSKNFGGVIAASSVNMSVPAGQITGLIGPNGAGKTTIVNLITGMLEVTSGRILIGSNDITLASATEVGRAGIVRTFQNIRLLPEATVIENVLVGFHRHEQTSIFSCLLGMPASRRETQDMRGRAEALLSRFGMQYYGDHLAGSLSYGHQRRVEMMRALASSPALLLLDEPVAGMNDVEALELGGIFRSLSEEGTGILLIEHNLRFVSKLCDSVYVLDCGRLIANGTPKSVIEDPDVIAAYLGR